MSTSVVELITFRSATNQWHSAARATLMVVLMAAPLAFGAVEPWAWSGLAAGAFLILLLWAGASAKSRQLSVSGTPLYLPLLLLLLLMVFQCFGHATFDPIGARESVVKFLLFTTLFFLSRELYRGESASSWSQMGLAVVIYAFALALFATVQFFSSPGLLYWKRRPLWGGTVFGPYVNHNHYAGLMEILIPVGLGYILSARQSKARPILVFAILVAIASVLLSGSRGGMIALVTELILFSVLVLRKEPEAKPARVFLVGALTLAAIAVLLFVWLDPGDVTKRLEQTASSPKMSIADRERYAFDTFRIIRDYPILGVGAGSFESAYPAYQSFSSDLVVNHVHNDYLEALAETGIVGFVLVLCAIGLFLRQVFFLSLHRSNWIGIGAAVGCCGLLIHSFSDFNLHIPANAAWFAYAAAIATVSRESSTRSLSRQKSDQEAAWYYISPSESCS